MAMTVKNTVHMYITCQHHRRIEVLTSHSSYYVHTVGSSSSSSSKGINIIAIPSNAAISAGDIVLVLPSGVFCYYEVATYFITLPITITTTTTN